MDWGRLATGVVTGGLSEVGRQLDKSSPARQQRELLDNEFRDVAPTHAYGVNGAIDRERQIQELMAQGAPQADTAQAGTSGFRNDQRGLASQLMAQAQGAGPGQQLVDQRVRDQTNRGLAQLQALQASGGGGAAAGRAAMQQGSALQAGARGASVQGGLQAQLQAQTLANQALGTGRAQDQRLALENAQLRQQGGQFNAQQQAQNQQLGLQGLGLSLEQAKANQQGMMQREQDRLGRFQTIGQVAQKPGASGNQMAIAGLAGAAGLLTKDD